MHFVLQLSVDIISLSIVLLKKTGSQGIKTGNKPVYLASKL